jgi:Methyltransferase domain
MVQKPRVVLPELLDDLAPTDPRATRSRRDLQRVHRAMGTVSILRRAIAQLRLAVPPTHILELGAGDGTILLRLARALEPRWHDVSLTVLDRYDLLSKDTREGYRQLGWSLIVLRADALSWAQERKPQRYDLSVATLFLHHFDAEALSELIPAIASCSNAFVACEPRRDIAAKLGSRLVGILGANEVTRADAVTSVAAGFVGQELTSVWPRAAGDWSIEESLALPFTHRFTAVRAGAQK